MGIALDAEQIWEEEQHLNKENKWRGKGHIGVLEVDLLFYSLPSVVHYTLIECNLEYQLNGCDFTSLAADSTCGAFIASVLLSLEFRADISCFSLFF